MNAIAEHHLLPVLLKISLPQKIIGKYLEEVNILQNILNETASKLFWDLK